ncbi:unnamed protein product [Peniophora sp. CBMAI 1063]|nr:unnamed protein product [Peniophora sp. CBMAI 1063]
MDSSDSSECAPGVLDTLRPAWADYPPFSSSDPADASDASDSDTSSILTHVSHTYGDEDMDALIREKPMEMLENLRVLSAQRVHRGPNEELRKVANTFARVAEKCMNTNSEDATLPESREMKKMWRDIVKLGLMDYLEDVVKGDTLFDENPIWVNYILILVDGVRHCVTKSSNALDIDQYLRLFGNLCQNAYIHRMIFVEGNHIVDRYAPDYAQKLRLRMNRILCLSLGKPLDLLKGRRLADLEDYKHLHRLLLHNWYYRADDDGWEVHIQLTFAFAVLESPNAESTVEDYESFADEIIYALGARQFLESLSKMVRDKEVPPLILGRDLLFVKYIVPWKPFHPHYCSSGFFEAVREALDRYMCMGASLKNEWQVYEPTLLLLTEIIRRAPVGEGAGPLIKRFDVIELIACSSICYAQLATVEDTNTACVEAIQVFTASAHTLALYSNKNVLKKVFKKNLKDEWYATLKTLRDMPARGQAASRRRTARLAAMWLELGLAVGLDEDEERELYEKEMRKAAQKCAWKECEYYRRKPPRPTSRCVGCGDVRYCSRACQRRHWKAEHQAHCGNRLKDGPK